MKYAALSCLMLASCAGPASSPSPSPTGAMAVAAGPGETWLDADRQERHVSGGITVEVFAAKIGRVEVESITGGIAESENERLSIRVRVTNADPNRKPEYKTWGLRNFDLSPKPRLSDEYGNKYKAVSFGAAARVVGSVDASASLYSEKPVEDVLVFESPLPSAKELRLELPAQNIGGQGIIRFRISPPR